MPHPRILYATWEDGIYILDGDKTSQEFAGKCVRGLADDDAGGAFAVVDQRNFFQLDNSGNWNRCFEHDGTMSCSVTYQGTTFVGTDDEAQLLHWKPGEAVRPVDSLEKTQGRESWIAGGAVIDGQFVGPPLGIRSLAVNSDHSVVLANIHVGGIARSTNGGNSWEPTIEIMQDVHEVRFHPQRPELAVAAAATGFCFSNDGGKNWSVTQQGLHACYGSAVAFHGDTIFLAASSDHFASEGAIYSTSVGNLARLSPLNGGFPQRLEGISDTQCIAVLEKWIAIADRGGNVYVSQDSGANWTKSHSGLPSPSSLLIVPG